MKVGKSFFGIGVLVAKTVLETKCSARGLMLKVDPYFLKINE